MILDLLKKIIPGMAAMLLFASCADRYETVSTQLMVADQAKTYEDTLVKDPGADFYFSRLTKPASFGVRFEYKLSEAQLGKGFYVVFSGRTRTNYAQSNAIIAVITHNQAHEQVSWRSVFLKRHYTDINAWCYFKDSVRLGPVEERKPYSSITAVAFLGGSTHENFDLDTLHVAIKQKI